MKESPNGWNAWYTQWEESFSDEGEDITPDIIPYVELADWGESFRRHVMLNDHWTGYLHPEQMSLEDGMSIAFVLYDAGINVDELLDVLESFQPFEGSPLDFGIPLCWLTEPMDHVQDLLGMLANISDLGADVLEEAQQMLGGALEDEVPIDPDELPGLFRAIIISTVAWLLEMMKILGDNGILALRAWWQGRLITLLREASAPKRRRSRRSRPGKAEVPSAFRDLIQSLDFRGIGAEDEDLDEAESSGPEDDSGKY